MMLTYCFTKVANQYFIELIVKIYFLCSTAAIVFLAAVVGSFLLHGK